MLDVHSEVGSGLLFIIAGASPAQSFQGPISAGHIAIFNVPESRFCQPRGSDPRKNRETQLTHSEQDPYQSPPTTGGATAKIFQPAYAQPSSLFYVASEQIAHKTFLPLLRIH
jgi:hypothetical protein